MPMKTFGTNQPTTAVEASTARMQLTRDDGPGVLDHDAPFQRSTVLSVIAKTLEELVPSIARIESSVPVDLTCHDFPSKKMAVPPSPTAQTWLPSLPHTP